MLRSILTIASCIVAWGVGWVSANLGLARLLPGKFDANGITTDPALLVTFIAVSVVLSVFAGWMCARLAGRAPMRHVWILAAIQLFIGIMVQAGVWDLMPVWYHLIFLGLVVPAHGMGGRFGVARRSARGVGAGTVGAHA